MKSFFFKIVFSCCCFLIASSTLVANTTPYKSDNTPSSTQTIFKTLNKEEILTVTISTALDSLTIHKNKDRYFPAALTYADEDGTIMNRSIKIKPRGRSRRKVCGFPPLKIKFCKKELAAAGIRNAHKSLKLVTHCSDEKDAMQNVLEEYLAYKVYNELTENSLKVQLVKVNYEDTESTTTLERYAILIEDIDELAERLDGEEVEGFGKELQDFDAQLMNTFSTFQYMIGNEDWRVGFQRNVKFIKSDKVNNLIPIPYDFDASGLVNAGYAKPDRDLRLSSVRQRAFIGYFKNKAERAATVALFNNKKEAVYQVILDCKSLNEIEKKAVINYFDGFYNIINTPKLLKIAMPLKGKTSEPTGVDGVYTK